MVVAVPPAGWGISRRAQSAFQFSRSSARSIDAALGAEHELGGQAARQLQRGLPAERHHHADQARAAGPGRCLLGLDDVHHVLVGERLEVEAVGGVVVGRDRLRVAVQHDGLVAGVAEGEAGVDAAVVELDALPDAVGARPEDQHLRPVAGAHLGVVLVGGVVVRRVGGELGTTGVDGLVDRVDPGCCAGRAHGGVVDAPEPRELGVGEPEALGAPPVGPGHGREADLGEVGTLLGDEADLVEEPRVDAGGGRQVVDADAPTQGRLELERPVGRADRGAGHQLVERPLVGLGLGGVAVQAAAAGLERPEGLLQRLGEGAADGHGLPHRLHLGAEHGLGAGELLERPPRHLGDHVVDGGLEAGRRGLGDVVRDLVEGVAHGELGGDLGDREAGGLRGERARAADPRVHLDDHEVAVGRVERELHVRPTGLDADAADALEGGVAHGLVLDVGQRLRGGDGDGVTGVHAHGVEVLDGADDDAVVGPVAHDLELVLLPARDRLLDEDLADGAGVEAQRREGLELLVGGGDAGALAAEDVGGPDDDGQAHPGQHLAGLLDGVRGARGRHVEADLLHRDLELVAVLGGGDGLGVGADELDVVLLEHAGRDQLHGQVEGRLAAEGGQQRVGLLPLDDAGEDADVERLDVGGVGELRVGHDRGRVRVGEDDAVALLAQHAAGLGARVVELARLADDDGAGPDEEDGGDVGALRHQACPSDAGSPDGS